MNPAKSPTFDDLEKLGLSLHTVRAYLEAAAATGGHEDENPHATSWWTRYVDAGLVECREQAHKLRACSSRVFSITPLGLAALEDLRTFFALTGGAE